MIESKSAVGTSEWTGNTIRSVAQVGAVSVLGGKVDTTNVTEHVQRGGEHHVTES